jgi:hypothetical protein
MTTLRKTVLIRHENISAPWDQMINIPFVPDEMIIRSVSYLTTGAVTNTFPQYVSSSLTSDDALCIITDANAVHNPETHIMLARPIMGNFNFRVRTIANAQSASTGRLMILIEFIKHF